MNKKTLLLITMTFGAINIASAKNKLHIAGQEISGKASSALKTKKPQKDVKWSGVVVQTINNEKDTCYQIIETRDTPQGKPSFDVLTNANSFIACQDNTGDTEQYNNALVTISGDVVNYYHSTKDNHDFPVLEIKSVKMLSRNGNYNHYNSVGDSHANVNGSRSSKQSLENSMSGYRGSSNK